MKDQAATAGIVVGGAALLLTTLFPNFNILQPFNPDPSNGTREPPPLGTRLAWAALIGGMAAILASGK